jgi:hypothetical protein
MLPFTRTWVRCGSHLNCDQSFGEVRKLGESGSSEVHVLGTCCTSRTGIDYSYKHAFLWPIAH